MRYHLLSTFAGRLPSRIDAENFDFYGRNWTWTTGAGCGVGNGVRTRPTPHWVGTGAGVCAAVLCPETRKLKRWRWVGDIEHAMGARFGFAGLDVAGRRNLRAKEQTARGGEQNRLSGQVARLQFTDSFAGRCAGERAERATAFENDRQLTKIGKPVDKTEWGMTPPTVDAYYDPTHATTSIFPRGHLQAPFYDPKADDAVELRARRIDHWA